MFYVDAGKGSNPHDSHGSADLRVSRAYVLGLLFQVVDYNGAGNENRTRMPMKAAGFESPENAVDL